MLVGNLEKVFTFQRGEALRVESQAWVNVNKRGGGVVQGNQFQPSS